MLTARAECSATLAALRRRARWPILAAAYMALYVPVHMSWWPGAAGGAFPGLVRTLWGTHSFREQHAMDAGWAFVINLAALSAIELWMGHAGLVWWLVLCPANLLMALHLNALLCSADGVVPAHDALYQSGNRYGSSRTDPSHSFALALLVCVAPSRRIRIVAAIALASTVLLASTRELRSMGMCRGSLWHVEFLLFGAVTGAVVH